MVNSTQEFPGGGGDQDRKRVFSLFSRALLAHLMALLVIANVNSQRKRKKFQWEGGWGGENRKILQWK